MIDTLLKHRERATKLNVPQSLGINEDKYIVVTLHRPSNVDDPSTLEEIMAALEQLALFAPVVFPVHPRTRHKLEAIRQSSSSEHQRRLHFIDPQGYLEFINLVAGSALVITDSGGVQEETTVLRVPCITLRNNTERPITLTRGTNQLVGTNPQAMLATAQAVLTQQWQLPDLLPDLWDGLAAQRIVDVIEDYFS
jgi:UDP-N-acetylglucosamine 2-epimerase (non-hydrolysing)